MSTPPLHGLTVLDFTRVLAGPYCTMLLAELGADVIKLERPDGGDDTREWGPPFVGDDAAYFLAVNRDKRSVTVDLTDPAGVARVREMAATADILVENFRDGVMARFGLGLGGLRDAHPALITCSIPAYTAPGMRDRPGYDLLMQGATGFMSITGQQDGEPTKVGVAILDVIAGLYAAIGIVAAVTARARDGVGQHVEVGLFDAAAAALVNQAASHLLAGDNPTRRGNAHPSIVPYQLFHASDGPFLLAGGNDKLFALSCVALGLPALATDARYRTNEDRVRHREELVTAMAAAARTNTAAHWLGELTRLGVPAGPVRSIQEVFASPEGQHGLITVEDPVRGPLTFVRTPIGLSGTPLRTDHTPPPLLGEHS